MGKPYDSSDDDLEYHPPTREEVFAQLEDWRQRLHKLYADIISWLPEGEGYETEIRDYMTDEPPMRYVGVEPQPVPELVVRRHGESVALLHPDACWIIGVLGRVMIHTSAPHPHKLVEVDFPESEAGWRLYRSDWPRPEWDKPLDRRLLRGILLDKQALRSMVGANNG